MDGNAMDLIELDSIHKTYRMGELSVPVLKGVSLNIARGELVALMGASGSGKTTLMNILGCLDRPTSGAYLLDGERIDQMTNDERAMVRNHKVGFVFQSFNLLARTSALDNVTMPLAYTAGHLSERDWRQRARALLARVGLGDRMDHKPTELSGGQMQRVAIARALAMQPDVILADEPTGNLDTSAGGDIMALFSELWQQGSTLVVITHDMSLARRAGRIVEVRDGRIISDGEAAA